ncbi:glycoside hydrolase family 57 protein [Fulvivirga sp. 29W222]|uniref:Glycoside hydrolase family 57 protein n=1 Tax=Fulvivirga marina TaxID=2494733 RepID=A0A937FZ84_9BACT|nr:glycoside hydrolase family 57 protein [Fulvivirga marina]MBL6448855.1 glycoside hydrolase family 57 protein [Fulvivirga marina]
MSAICFYFQIHQPFRLRPYRFFDIGRNHDYYDETTNPAIIKKIAEKCYLPANEIIHNLICRHNGNFKVSFSISGSALDQFERYAPEILTSFQKLVDTGCVELLAETYAHSLASVASKKEFRRQVSQHVGKIYNIFGQHPKVFRNTELIYNDAVAHQVADMGFNGILTEGADSILAHKSPNYVYLAHTPSELKVLLKNYKLSDDIAFRFSDQSWNQWPLSADKYVHWLNRLPEQHHVINLFMDYETFGEHQWADSGIFNFLQELPEQILSSSGFSFVHPSEALNKFEPIDILSVPHTISWADEARDLSAWLGNSLQCDAFESLYKLKKKVRRCENPEILRDWQYLQASDHFYYMSTKDFADGQVHNYFNPYPSPYLAFINYMNVLSDFEVRLNKCLRTKARLIKHKQLIENLLRDEKRSLEASVKV